MDNTSPPARRDKLLGWAMALSALVLVLFATSKYGPGISSVSGDYISAGESLLAGRGFLQHDGSVYNQYPPLLPVLVALAGLVHLSPLVFFRFFNAACFAAIVLFCYRWYSGRFSSSLYAAGGGAAVLFSFPLLGVAVFAWPEPLFVLLVVLFLIECERAVLGGGKRASLRLGLIGGLASLTRYIGVTLSLSAVVLLSAGLRWGRKEKLGEAARVVLLGIVPVGLWLLRNWVVSSTLTGERGPSSFTLLQNVYFTLSIASSWFFPYKLPVNLRVVLLLIGLVLIALAYASLMRRGKGSQPAIGSLIFSPLLFAAIYLLALLASATLISLDKMNSRFLCPLVPGTFFLIFLGLSRLGELRLRLLSKRVLAAAVVLWLAFQGRSLGKNVLHLHRIGGGGYATDAWRNSPTILYLERNGLPGIVYSNESYAIYMLTGIPARLSPRRYLFNSPRSTTRDIERFEDELAGGGGTYLVWFDSVHREYLYDVDYLARRYRLDLVAELADGKVYRVAPKRSQ